MKTLICWIIAGNAFFSPPVPHPFHVSLTQCKYNVETKSLEISMRLFTDDLEEAINEDLRRAGGDKSIQDSLIGQYLSDKFYFTTPGSLDLKPVYLGLDMDYDISFVFMEIPEFPLEEYYQLKQTVLFDKFEDQTNIVKLKVENKTASSYFTGSETVKLMELE